MNYRLPAAEKFDRPFKSPENRQSSAHQPGI